MVRGSGRYCDEAMSLYLVGVKGECHQEHEVILADELSYACCAFTWPARSLDAASGVHEEFCDLVVGGSPISVHP